MGIDDTVLMIDGTTDGGCHNAAPVPADDKLGKCPTGTTADEECLLGEESIQPLPVKAMAYAAGCLCGFICCFACCIFCCLRRVRNDKWIYGREKVLRCS